MLIILFICSITEVMFDQGSICEILCVWNHHLRIVSTDSRCAVSGYRQFLECVHSKYYVVKKSVEIILKSVVSHVDIHGTPHYIRLEIIV